MQDEWLRNLKVTTWTQTPEHHDYHQEVISRRNRSRCLGGRAEPLPCARGWLWAAAFWTLQQGFFSWNLLRVSLEDNCCLQGLWQYRQHRVEGCSNTFSLNFCRFNIYKCWDILAHTHAFKLVKKNFLNLTWRRSDLNGHIAELSHFPLYIHFLDESF